MDQFISKEVLDILSYHSTLGRSLKQISLRKTPLPIILDDIEKYRANYIDTIFHLHYNDFSVFLFIFLFIKTILQMIILFRIFWLIMINLSFYFVNWFLNASGNLSIILLVSIFERSIRYFIISFNIRKKFKADFTSKDAITNNFRWYRKI